MLGACQPLPHPFADDQPPPNSPLLTPPDSVGIMVEPVAGAPEPTAHDLAAAMAAALQAADVPASDDASNRGSYRLTGRATAAPAGGDRLRVTIAWDMRQPDGTSVGRQEISLVLSAAAWRSGGNAVAEFARAPAPSLAKLVEAKTPPPVAGAGALIAVHRATGAPGDGGDALAAAMANALRRAQLVLADKAGDRPEYILDAQVTVTPAAAGQQDVKIAWLLRGADGRQIGRVSQENTVAAGSLDGAWGLTAYDVAAAAAPGVAALIEEAKRAAVHS